MGKTVTTKKVNKDFDIDAVYEKQVSRRNNLADRKHLSKNYEIDVKKSYEKTMEMIESRYEKDCEEKQIHIEHLQSLFIENPSVRTKK